jgi:hypothetical protein
VSEREGADRERGEKKKKKRGEKKKTRFLEKLRPVGINGSDQQSSVVRLS